ncbi:hypothetical protein K1T71_006146 [Dendrolimus kikuchii]|uniref:Uncharacterized protein n=1 Tax=Dendrolimus kikuchii TaxID=765133 RepID=A0ACC1D351_9NEOP|nr:hypothetical protein K1T71_006146 [Dendrolimus kikuchii]
MNKIFWIVVFALIAAATAEPWWYPTSYPVASSMAYTYGPLSASAPLVNTGPFLFDGTAGLPLIYSLSYRR